MMKRMERKKGGEGRSKGMRKEPRKGEEDGREMLYKRYFIIKK